MIYIKSAGDEPELRRQTSIAQGGAWHDFGQWPAGGYVVKGFGEAARETDVVIASDACEIYLVWSDVRIEVPAGTSLLDALIAAGVPIEPGCRVGSCGECVTEYVEGEVTHKDSCLSVAERGNRFCPCVSRARGTLVLPF